MVVLARELARVSQQADMSCRFSSLAITSQLELARSLPSQSEPSLARYPPLHKKPPRISSESDTVASDFQERLFTILGDVKVL